MQHSPVTGVDCGGGFCSSGYDRTEDNIEPIMHYCEEACTRCLAAEQDTKRKARPLAICLVIWADCCPRVHCPRPPMQGIDEPEHVSVTEFRKHFLHIVIKEKYIM